MCKLGPLTLIAPRNEVCRIQKNTKPPGKKRIEAHLLLCCKRGRHHTDTAPLREARTYPPLSPSQMRQSSSMPQMRAWKLLRRPSTSPCSHSTIPLSPPSPPLHHLSPYSRPTANRNHSLCRQPPATLSRSVVPQSATAPAFVPQFVQRPSLWHSWWPPSDVNKAKIVCDSYGIEAKASMQCEGGEP